MATPGSNILKTALRVIASQKIQYIAFVSRPPPNSIGMFNPIYAPAITISGSIQPIPRHLFQQLGLDLQKHYVNIFVPNALVDIRRDVSSDKFQYGGATYQGLSMTKWFTVDSWNEILCVEVPS